jgi:protein SCO1/2
MKKTFFWLVLGLAAGLILTAGLALARTHTLNGSVLEPPQPAAQIALEDFRLSDQKGKVVLVFFGYTFCPDVCPATLGTMKRFLERVGNQADRVEVVFVTVDPQRDTTEKMDAYTSAFDPRITGLSGTEADLEQVWQAYWVFHEAQPAGSSGAYLVDHSSQVFLIDPQGNLRTTYAFGTSAEDIAADVRFLLR